MIISYFLTYMVLVLLYVMYYFKIDNTLKGIINEKDAKYFDKKASLHSLLYTLFTVVVLLFNIVFLFIFINRYGCSWRIIIPIGSICIILLLIVTITGFKYKKKILKLYRDKYGYELHFYDQVGYISLFRQTCILSNSILLTNILILILMK